MQFTVTKWMNNPCTPTRLVFGYSFVTRRSALPSNLQVNKNISQLLDLTASSRSAISISYTISLSFVIFVNNALLCSWFLCASRTSWSSWTKTTQQRVEQRREKWEKGKKEQRVEAREREKQNKQKQSNMKTNKCSVEYKLRIVKLKMERKFN